MGLCRLLHGLGGFINRLAFLNMYRRGYDLTAPESFAYFVILGVPCLCSSTIMPMCHFFIVLFDLIAQFSRQTLIEDLWLRSSFGCPSLSSIVIVRSIVLGVFSTPRSFGWSSARSLSFSWWWGTWMLLVCRRVGSLILRSFAFRVSFPPTVGLVCKATLRGYDHEGQNRTW